MNEPTPKPAGTWDFYGACAPHMNKDGTFNRSMGVTFTLGCFQWEERSRGKGTKKGKVQKRFKGVRWNPKPTFYEAQAFCEEMNAKAATEAPQ